MSMAANRVMSRTPDAELAISCREVRFRYRERTALDGVDLNVPRGVSLCLLGPNGSGKSTLFRILSTLVAAQTGSVTVLGDELPSGQDRVRRRIGVLFQHPALDRKLTVEENLRLQTSLYGIPWRHSLALSKRALERAGLTDRADERVEKLSGGLARRVELAKTLLHEPDLLLMDEPSVGLDPAARRQFLGTIAELRDAGVTVLFTSHLMDEAERADRVAIMDAGRIVAAGRPEELRGEIGGRSITVECHDPVTACEELARRFAVEVTTAADGSLRFHHPDAPALVPGVAELLGDRLNSISVARPSLEDVYFRRTGRAFRSDADG
jgi:ABC-2 type transport system ATP-binding protein